MEFERKAAIMGGGNFVVPVQMVTDFMESRLSGRFVISLIQIVLYFQAFI